MKFNSTRNIDSIVGFKEAVFQGLAPDGGLYQPMEEPDMKQFFLGLNEKSSFVDIAAGMMHRLLSEDFNETDCKRVCSEAFPFKPDLHKIGDEIFLLELFHGPSCAFKDFGASFLATIMQEYLRKDKQKAIILTATSGDTGSAVAQAFFGKENIDVVILYPSGRVSPSQEMQLTTMGGNIHALEVKGSFDDCQRMVKEAFLDPALRAAFPLTSANSINLGRLIPQSFYYAYAFAQYKKYAESGELYFSVPSGNFGNLTAGILAWRWGLPVTGFIAASNENAVVPEFLDSGVYKPRPSVQTVSNAMDVGNPSNFERLQSLFNFDWQRQRSFMIGDKVSDSDTLQVMRRYQREQGLFLCPHSAVGVLAAERFRDANLRGSGSVISLATAHPGKFSEVVRQACGVDPDIPERLAEFMRRTKRATLIGNTLKELSHYLETAL